MLYSIYRKAIDYAKKTTQKTNFRIPYLQLAIIFELEKNNLAIDYYIRAMQHFTIK